MVVRGWRFRRCRPRGRRCRAPWTVVGLGAPEAQVFGVEWEGDSAGFVRLEGDAEEALELADGARGAASALVGVELDDFVARTAADVLHVDGDAEGGGRRGRRALLCADCWW